jgi:alpha-1,6-mannosyltransferase
MGIVGRMRSYESVLALTLLGLAALAVYVAAAAVPFSITSLGGTPLLSFAGMTGQTRAGVVRYLLTLGVPFLLYAFGFLVLWRKRVPRAVVFAMPALFCLALVFVYPLTALDVFLYGAQGWTLSQHGANPLVVPPSTFPDNPFLGWTAYTGQPSTYGPLWIYMSALVTILGGTTLTALVGFKVLGMAALLGSMALTYLIAEQLRPGRGRLAAYTLGWNPLALWVTVANGHNDMAMMFFVLLGVFLLLRRPLFALSAIAMAGLVKYSAFLLLPVFLVYLWRRGYPWQRLGLSLGVAAVCAWVVMGPLWAGPETLTALRDQMQDMLTMSPGATLVFWLEARGMPAESAERLARDVLYIAFAVVYALALTRVDRRRGSAVAVSFVALTTLLILATFWFRSWYVVWPLALAALLVGSHRWLAAAGIAFSGSALLVYLFTDYLWVWYGTDLKLHLILMAVVFAPPLLLLAAGAGIRLVWGRRESGAGLSGARA